MNNRTFIISFLFLFLGINFQIEAQELNCNVQVNANQVQGSVVRIFESMESDIRDFMNNSSWTNDQFKSEEKIKCNILITISSREGNNRFNATIQVTSSRPIFNSDYESPMLNIKDQDFLFQYDEGTPLIFSPDQFRDNLTQVLAFYAYLILSFDYDSFSLKGGDYYFNICRQIITNAQNTGSSGWRALDSDRNRYWIIENILAGNFVSMREAIYTYHRKGMDEMYDNVIGGRNEILASLDLIKRVHQSKPLAYATQVFFQAKADELVNIFSNASPQEKSKAYNILQVVDPGNLNKYNKLKN